MIVVICFLVGSRIQARGSSSHIVSSPATPLRRTYGRHIRKGRTCRRLYLEALISIVDSPLRPFASSLEPQALLFWHGRQHTNLPLASSSQACRLLSLQQRQIGRCDAFALRVLLRCLRLPGDRAANPLQYCRRMWRVSAGTGGRRPEAAAKLEARPTATTFRGSALKAPVRPRPRRSFRLQQ
jgi:hypothetical protein